MSVTFPITATETFTFRPTSEEKYQNFSDSSMRDPSAIPRIPALPLTLSVFLCKLPSFGMPGPRGCGALARIPATTSEPRGGSVAASVRIYIERMGQVLLLQRSSQLLRTWQGLPGSHLAELFFPASLLNSFFFCTRWPASNSTAGAQSSSDEWATDLHDRGFQPRRAGFCTEED